MPTRSVFTIPAFRVVFAAEAVSVFGTQLARFALAVLVFERTGSAAASALTYATSFLPAVLGGLVLGQLGDRFPQRAVMVTVDVARACLFAVMALPGMPVPALLCVLIVAVFLDPAFSSAQLSYLAGSLDAELFRKANGVRATADQAIQVVGFGLGGAIVLAISPRGALLLDAATFLASAFLLLLLLRGSAERPVARDDAPPDAAALVDQADGPLRPPEVEPRFEGLWRDRRTRLRMGFTLLVGLYVLPEALAVAYAAEIGASTAQAGALLAMIPLGTAIGCFMIIRVPRRQRGSVTNALAILCGLPLVVCAVQPDWLVSMACWFVCGLLTSFEVEVLSALVLAVPASSRSRLSAMSGVWLNVSQGVCFALAGVAAQFVGPASTIALAGGVGSVVAVAFVALLGSSGAIPGRLQLNLEV